MHILTQRIPSRIHMHEKKNRSNDSNTSSKQPWRLHPRGCQEEEARRSKSQERQFQTCLDFHQLLSRCLDRRFRSITSHGCHKSSLFFIVCMQRSSYSNGGNSPVEVIDNRRIELNNVRFENVLHVPKLSVNLLSMYQMKNFDIRKKVIFTPNAVDIYDMQTNSSVATSKVNHQSRLYTFFEFIEPDFDLLLTMLMKLVGYGMEGSGI
jgi:hypothetical protein